MLDENKTDDPRSWALDPGVARALKMWKEAYCKDPKVDDHVFVDPTAGAPLHTLHLADRYGKTCAQPASPAPRSSAKRPAQADPSPRLARHVRHR